MHSVTPVGRSSGGLELRIGVEYRDGRAALALNILGSQERAATFYSSNAAHVSSQQGQGLWGQVTKHAVRRLRIGRAVRLPTSWTKSPECLVTFACLRARALSGRKAGSLEWLCSDEVGFITMPKSWVACMTLFGTVLLPSLARGVLP